MSYSLSAKADSKTAVLLALEAKFEEVLRDQPAHAADQEAAFINVRRHLELLDAPAADQDVGVSMYGSISTDNGAIVSVGSGCSVGLVTRPATAG